MELRQLEAFSYVVETGSFSRAAELLGVSQPTVSAHVTALERELGVPVVETVAVRSRGASALVEGIERLAGHLQTPVPVLAKSSMPAASSLTQCACQTSGPTQPSCSAYSAGVQLNFSRV